MRVVIPKESYPREFVDWLTGYMKYRIVNSMRNSVRTRSDVELKNLLYTASKALVIKELKSAYIIEISDSIMYEGTKQSLASLCRTVSYGSLSSKGYGLLTNIFSRVSSDLTKYYEWFLLEYF